METEKSKQTNDFNHQQQEGAPNHPEAKLLEEIDTELIILIIILLIFFQQPNVFKDKFELLNNHVKTIKNYLNTADETIQALNQASQIPAQNLD